MTNRWITRICGGFVCAVVAWYFVNGRVAVPVAAAASCESLMSLKLPSTTITLAKVEGAAELPGVKVPPAKPLPDTCRVAATLRPSSDSEITMEIWMPVSNWNGKYLATTRRWRGS